MSHCFFLLIVGDKKITTLNLIIVCSMSGYGTQNYHVRGIVYTRVSEEEKLHTRKIGTMGLIVSSASLNQSCIVNAWFDVPLCTSSVHVHVQFSSCSV